MRQISFSMTLPQVEARTKTQTRRLGWWDAEADRPRAKPGDRLIGIEKGRGLKKGERVKPIAVVEVVRCWREPIEAITQADVSAEGFPDMTPVEFVDFFCKANRCERDRVVTVIEFKYPEIDEITAEELSHWGRVVLRHEESQC